MDNLAISREVTVMLVALIVFGSILILSGFCHRIPSLGKRDVAIFRFLNRKLSEFTGFFVHLWHLGTSPVAWILIAMTYIRGLEIGITITLVYSMALIAEGLVKRGIGRQRPFETLPGIVQSQPKPPKDASFPSGDAMRVSYLALIIPTVFDLHWTVFVAACLIALAVSAGRIALGVHFFLDVLGGAGLGILGAGCAILTMNLWQVTTI